MKTNFLFSVLYQLPATNEADKAAKKASNMLGKQIVAAHVENQVLVQCYYEATSCRGTAWKLRTKRRGGKCTYHYTSTSPPFTWLRSFFFFLRVCALSLPWLAATNRPITKLAAFRGVSHKYGTSHTQQSRLVSVITLWTHLVEHPDKLSNFSS